MALSLDEFRGSSTRGPRCTFGLLLMELDPKDREVVETALADPRVTASRVAEVLTDAGHEIGDYTVARHRKGGCKC